MTSVPKASKAETPAALSLLDDALPVGIARCDESGTVLTANAALLAMVGRPVDEMVGQPATSLLDRRRRAHADSIHQEAMITGETTAEEWRVRRPDGAYVDLLVTGRAVDEREGGGRLRLLSFADVTTLRDRQRGAEAERARFESYFMHAPENIFIARVGENDSIILEAHNPASEQATGLPNDVIAGKSPEDVLPPDVAERAMAQYRVVLATGKPLDSVDEFTFEGHRRVWHTILVPIRDRDGQITHIQGRSRDVTEDVRFRRKLKDVEDLLESIYQVADVGISVVDKDLRLVTTNQAYARFIHETPENLIGRSVLDLIPDEARHSVIEWHRQVMAGITVRDMELEGINPKGEPIIYSLSSNRFIDGGSRPFAVTVLSDITHLKQLERDLSEREERLRLVADNMPALIGLLDREEKILFANQQFRDWLGLTGQELTGRPIAEILPPGGEAILRAPLQRVRSGRETTFQQTYRHPRGDDRNLRLSLIPRSRHDGYDGFYIFAFDMTAISRTQAELISAKERAETANQSKSQFLANMSHELRTPLNAIIGFSELMADEAFGPLGSDTYRAYIGDILGSGRHLLNLINEILDLSKIEAGQFDLLEEEFDLATATAEALALVRVRARRGEVALSPEIGTDAPRLRADPRAFKQMLLNLLSNAIKFTPPGGRVTLTSRLNGNDALTVAVNDTGIGIPPHRLEEIGLPFVQLDNVMTRRHEGTGIGLSITKALIELHGGSLEVSNRRGGGTIAALNFPPERVVRALRD
ncbi:PAS domain-containing protein [Inquilinus sp. CAU 1745]|uniref:PAS domain-containing protein n=1 Tax=Inquilinus sp. CAU 1745 TaxID=3140369 RepID=UPI00325C1524